MKAAIRLRFDFDELLRHLAILGIVSFLAWLSIGAMGYAAGYLEMARMPAIRFMVAVLVLVLPTVVMPDLQRFRYRNLSVDSRSGFEA